MIASRTKLPVIPARHFPERYGCTKGCVAPTRAIGSIFNPKDRTMWLHEPHKPIEMSQHQINEWLSLIQEAGLGS